MYSQTVADHNTYYMKDADRRADYYWGKFEEATPVVRNGKELKKQL